MPNQTLEGQEITIRALTDGNVVAELVFVTTFNDSADQEIKQNDYLGEPFARFNDVFVGYSVDDPDDDDLPTGGRDLNELIYVGANYRVWEPLRLGWEYIFWNTEFEGADDGTNNRFHVWMAYHF